MQRKLLISFLLFFLVKLGSAQVTLSASVEKDTMQMAAKNVYHLRLEHPSNVVIKSIDLQPIQADPIKKMEEAIDTTTFEDPAEKEMQKQMIQAMVQQMGLSGQVMEIQNKGNWQDQPDLVIQGKDAKWNTQTNGNTIINKNSITFTFWESGNSIILSPIIEYEQNGIIQTTTAGPTEVFVLDPHSTAETSPDSIALQPNKQILEEPFHFVEDLLIPAGTVLLVLGILVGLVFFFLRKGKLKLKPKKQLARPAEIIPASKIAFEKLKKLKDEGIWQDGKIKEYQSQLTYVIREYLENRYDINALENTTFQIGEDLKKLSLNESLRNDLQNILQVADLVKFAKAKPDENIHEQFLTKAEEFVQTTKKTTAQIEAEKAAQEAAYQKAIEDLKKKK